MTCDPRLVVGTKEDVPIFSKNQYQPGNWVIYRKQKSSEIPGPRAENVRAASKGNLYRYTVDKFWVVEDVDESGKLQLRTRRGKRHVVAPDDPHLRKARIWERWLYRDRFEGNEMSSNEMSGDDLSGTDQHGDSTEDTETSADRTAASKAVPPSQ